jgi:hypothetical protein
MYPNLSSDELAYAILAYAFRRYDGGRFSLAFPWITLLIIGKRWNKME